MDAVINLEDINKIYHTGGGLDVHAVRGVTATIQAGNSWPSWEPAAPANRP